MTTYPTKIDWWLRLMLFVPFFGAAASIYAGVTSHQRTPLIASAIALGLYALLMVTIGWPVRYTVSPEQLEVRFGLVRLRVPWDRVIAAELSQNPLSAPAYSLDRIEFRYTTDRGTERTFRISPPDRLAFLADCARASGNKLRVDGERLVR
ncbi:MAG: PH domain-containing protein [Kofleriaceae bacterium]